MKPRTIITALIFFMGVTTGMYFIVGELVNEYGIAQDLNYTLVFNETQTVQGQLRTDFDTLRNASIDKTLFNPTTLFTALSVAKGLILMPVNILTSFVTKVSDLLHLPFWITTTFLLLIMSAVFWGLINLWNRTGEV